MIKKIIGFSLLAFVFYYAGSIYYYTNFNAEGQMISIAIPLLEGLSGKKYTDPAEQRQMIITQIIRLKKVIKQDPAGAFADDAEYLVTVLMLEYPPEDQIKELELLLESYPKLSFEPKVAKVFAPFILNDVINARKDSLNRLCALYVKTSGSHRLKSLCE